MQGWQVEAVMLPEYTAYLLSIWSSRFKRALVAMESKYSLVPSE